MARWRRAMAVGYAGAAGVMVLSPFFFGSLLASTNAGPVCSAGSALKCRTVWSTPPCASASCADRRSNCWLQMGSQAYLAFAELFAESMLDLGLRLTAFCTVISYTPPYMCRVKKKKLVLVGRGLVVAIQWHGRLTSLDLGLIHVVRPKLHVLRELHALQGRGGGLLVRRGAAHICDRDGRAPRLRPAHQLPNRPDRSRPAGILDLGLVLTLSHTCCSTSSRPTRDVCHTLTRVHVCHRLFGAWDLTGCLIGQIK